MPDLVEPFAPVIHAVFWVVAVMTALGWALDQLVGLASPDRTEVNE